MSEDATVTEESSARRWFAHHRDVAWTCPEPGRAAADFHRNAEGYATTRLVALPAIASELGVGHVLVK